MGQLTGNQIDLSYQGLIKTTDNAALGAVEKEITDGVGTASTLKLGTTSASFVGTLDLTGATVLGGGGAAGLVSGTGTDSMKSADTLTPLATNLAGGQNAIVFGAGAIGNQDYGITIGTYAQSGIFSTTVGTYAEGSGLYCTAVGPSSKATADGAVSVGQLTESSGAGSVAIGREAKANGAKCISIGSGSTIGPSTIVIGDALGDPYGSNTIAIGLNYPTSLDFRGDSVSLGNAIYPSQFGVYIGNGANHTLGGATGAIAIGKLATTSADKSISIGMQSVSTATGSVALGYQVAAATANTVTVKKLQMLDYATMDYADDTAAAAGNIPLGGVYHTSGALKIRIV